MSWWRDVFFLKIRGTEVSEIFNVRRRSAVFTRTAGIAASERGKEPSSCAEKIDSGSACSEFRIDLTTQEQVELSLKININIHVQ